MKLKELLCVMHPNNYINVYLRDYHRIYCGPPTKVEFTLDLVYSGKSEDVPYRLADYDVSQVVGNAIEIHNPNVDSRRIMEV